MCVVPAMYELHDILGSWPPVYAAVGIDDAHGRRLRRPGNGARIKPATRARIVGALEEHRPFPLSDTLREARMILNIEKADPGSPKLKAYLNVLDGLLNSHEPTDRKLQVEYEYMRMLVAFSKGHHSRNKTSWFGGKKIWPEHLRAAQAHAEQGMRLADVIQNEGKDEQVAHLRGFLFINWVQIIQEQVKEGYAGLNGVKMTREQKEQLFEQKKVLEALKQLMIEFPYLWQAAFNGLEQSSSLRKDLYAIWFYEELKRLDPGFQDFDYSPGEVLAISAEPEMAYFNAKYRNVFHTPNPRRTK